MKNPNRNRVYLIGIGGLAGLGLALAGCASNESRPTTQSTPSAMAAPKSGAQMWGETCGRCHNIRNPTEFSNNEWQVVLHHMRIRANLTGEEERKILEFIEASNTGG